MTFGIRVGVSICTYDSTVLVQCPRMYVNGPKMEVGTCCLEARFYLVRSLPHGFKPLAILAWDEGFKSKRLAWDEWGQNSVDRLTARLRGATDRASCLFRRAHNNVCAICAQFGILCTHERVEECVSCFLRVCTKECAVRRPLQFLEEGDIKKERSMHAYALNPKSTPH